MDELSRIDSLTQEDYAGFLGGFCQKSSIKGPACLSTGAFSFSSLPIDLQLIYVDCQSHALSRQIDCLQYHVDKNQPIPYLGSIEVLCAKSFSTMRSSLLLDPPTNAALEAIASTADSNFQSRGVGNSRENNSFKSSKERKKDNQEGSPTEAATLFPSVSPVESLALKDMHSIPTAAPSLHRPTSEPTTSPSDSTFSSSDPTGPQASFSAVRIIGATSLGILLVALATLKVVRQRLRYACHRTEKSHLAVSDDASVLSEPSQLFKLGPRVGFSQDGSEQYATMKRWFEILPPLRDPLPKTTLPILLKWRGSGRHVKSKNGESVSSTSSHDALSEIDKEVPLFADSPKASMNEEGTPVAYHFDIYPMEDKVPSSLSSASQKDRKRTGTIGTLFRNRGSLFSRRHEYNTPRVTTPNSTRRDFAASAEQVNLTYPSRETRHENDILELQEAADYHNEKPWRKEIIRKTNTCDAMENEAPTIDDIESSFLSPDVAQQFRDVDQRLSDGLRQFREEDRKLGIEVDKFQASLRDSKGHEERSSSPDEALSEKSDSRNFDEQVVDLTDDLHTGPPYHNSETSSDEFEQLPAPIAGDQIDIDDHDDEEEDLLENRRRNPFTPTWIHQEQSDTLKAGRYTSSLPRRSFIDDTEQQHRTSLLPPRADSIDSTGADGD